MNAMTDSSRIRVNFPEDGETELTPGAKVVEALKKAGISNGALAAKVDGVIVDLSFALREDCSVEAVTFDSREGKQVLRHSASHIMASAVKEIFPDVKLAIGPSTDDGFYYDFDKAEPFTPEDLGTIEEKMRELIKADMPFERMELPRQKAIEYFRDAGEPYKVEILEEIPDGTVSAYKHGGFLDLCKGPHVPSTRYARHFKLLSTAGAYWRGKESNPMLQRIYGTAYVTRDELKGHISRLEEAKRRDHRRLGAELDLFSFHEEAGGGFVFWHPKGEAVIQAILDHWKAEHLKRGYQFVRTPHVAKAALWETSGHMDYYRENMYVFEEEGRKYVVKPMNCPGHVLIYKSSKRSYRELPQRYAELGTVYRNERSGVLHGLMRVRMITMDDAHIFCTEDQVADEIVGVVNMCTDMLRTFGFRDFKTELSVRDPNSAGDYAGEDRDWELAERALVGALEKTGLEYEVVVGEAAFYGPKIDIKMTDALGRTWQASTVQFDFNLPRRFGATYVGPDGREHYTVMVHRAILGSMERFVGILLEHYEGRLPVWIAPVQAVVISVGKEAVDYAEKISDRLISEGFRSVADTGDDTVGAKIRRAELQRIPYMLIVGSKEVSAGKVSVRSKVKGDEGAFLIDGFVARLRSDTEGKI
jgi:threonyl-tRNA synthetase